MTGSRWAASCPTCSAARSKPCRSDEAGKPLLNSFLSKHLGGRMGERGYLHRCTRLQHVGQAERTEGVRPWGACSGEKGSLHLEELGYCEHQRGAVSFRAPGGSKTCFCNEGQPHAGTYFHETKALKKK